VDAAALAALLPIARASENDFELEPYIGLLLSLARYRAGDFKTAAEHGAFVAAHARIPAMVKAAGAALLALAEQRRHEAARASAALETAHAFMAEHWPPRLADSDWPDSMFAQVLIAEAEQLIKAGARGSQEQTR